MRLQRHIPPAYFKLYCNPKEEPMRVITEIVETLKDHGIGMHSPHLIHIKGAPVMHKLLEAVYSGEAQDDISAVQLLYEDDTHKRNFNEVKRRLQRKLIGSLVLIGSASHPTSGTRIAYYQCIRLYTSAQILYLHQRLNSSETLATQAHRIAQKFEFTDIGILTSRYLEYFYSTIAYNMKKASKYADHVKSMQAIMMAENQIISLYNHILSIYGTKQSSPDSLRLVEIEEQITSVNLEHHEFRSYAFQRYYYLSMILIKEAQHDYRNCLELCQKAVNYLGTKDFDTSKARASFMLRQFVMHIYLRNYKNAKEVYANESIIVDEGSYDWYAWQHYYFILCSYQQDYTAALKCLSDSFGHSRYSDLPVTRKQLWQVLDAFMHFLISSNKIPEKDVKKYPLRPFRLFRFLNDVPIYSKDKRGVNVSILTIHILFLLDRKNYSRISERVDALNQYCRRYLLKDDTFRSNCFIKMLTQMPKANYNRLRTERYAANYHKRLLDMPIEKTRQGIETEPVPYEHLWEMVLERLK